MHMMTTESCLKLKAMVYASSTEIYISSLEYSDQVLMTIIMQGFIYWGGEGKAFPPKLSIHHLTIC